MKHGVPVQLFYDVPEHITEMKHGVPEPNTEMKHDVPVQLLYDVPKHISGNETWCYGTHIRNETWCSGTTTL